MNLWPGDKRQQGEEQEEPSSLLFYFFAAIFDVHLVCSCHFNLVIAATLCLSNVEVEFFKALELKPDHCPYEGGGGRVGCPEWRSAFMIFTAIYWSLFIVFFFFNGITKTILLLLQLFFTAGFKKIFTKIFTCTCWHKWINSNKYMKYIKTISGKQYIII